jgi:hypothetical protein
MEWWNFLPRLRKVNVILGYFPGASFCFTDMGKSIIWRLHGGGTSEAICQHGSSAESNFVSQQNSLTKFGRSEPCWHVQHLGQCHGFSGRVVKTAAISGIKSASTIASSAAQTFHPSSIDMLPRISLFKQSNGSYRVEKTKTSLKIQHQACSLVKQLRHLSQAESC